MYHTFDSVQRWYIVLTVDAQSPVCTNNVTVGVNKVHVVMWSECRRAWRLICCLYDSTSCWGTACVAKAFHAEGNIFNMPFFTQTFFHFFFSHDLHFLIFWLDCWTFSSTWHFWPFVDAHTWITLDSFHITVMKLPESYCVAFFSKKKTLQLRCSDCRDASLSLVTLLRVRPGEGVCAHALSPPALLSVSLPCFLLGCHYSDWFPPLQASHASP